MNEEMTSNYEDQELTCSDCGDTYIFTAGEQEFFAQKGFTVPKRCKKCRAAMKARKRQSRY